jgi:hypothetical protein
MRRPGRTPGVDTTVGSGWDGTEEGDVVDVTKTARLP